MLVFSLGLRLCFFEVAQIRHVSKTRHFQFSGELLWGLRTCEQWRPVCTVNRILRTNEFAGEGDLADEGR